MRQDLIIFPILTAFLKKDLALRLVTTESRGNFKFMGTSDIAQLAFLVLLLFLSAFFSSAETAFTTTSRIRMRTLAESGDKRAASVLDITDDMHKMLSAILIGNNVVNLYASSLATTLAIRLFGSVGAGIATGILTLLILIFGEISPKTLATINADKNCSALFQNCLGAYVAFDACYIYCKLALHGIFKTPSGRPKQTAGHHDRGRI